LKVGGHGQPRKYVRQVQRDRLIDGFVQVVAEDGYDAAGINRKTAIAYDTLLTNLFVLELVPAWASNRLTRLIKTPKRYLVDPALAGA